MRWIFLHISRCWSNVARHHSMSQKLIFLRNRNTSIRFRWFVRYLISYHEESGITKNQAVLAFELDIVRTTINPSERFFRRCRVTRLFERTISIVPTQSISRPATRAFLFVGRAAYRISIIARIKLQSDDDREKKHFPVFVQSNKVFNWCGLRGGEAIHRLYFPRLAKIIGEIPMIDIHSMNQCWQVDTLDRSASLTDNGNSKVFKAFRYRCKERLTKSYWKHA